MNPDAEERIARRLRQQWFVTIPVLVVAAGLGYLSVAGRVPERAYFEALLMIQATVVGFLLVVAIFLYEQQQPAVRAALALKDRMRISILGVGAVGSVLILGSVILSLSLISAPWALRIDLGWLAGGAMTTGMVATVTALSRLVKVMSPRWSTDRMVARAIRPTGDEAAHLEGHLQRQIDDLVTLARIEAIDGDRAAFGHRIRGLQEIHTVWVARTSTPARREDPTVDALIVLAGANLEKREFCLTALEGLGSALERTTGSGDNPNRIVDRIVSLLRRVSVQPIPSARVVASLLGLAGRAGAPVDSPASAALVGVALEMGSRADAPTDVVDCIRSGLAGLIRDGVVRPRSLISAPAKADPEVRTRWNRLALHVAVEGRGRRGGGRTFDLDPNDSDVDRMRDIVKSLPGDGDDARDLLDLLSGLSPVGRRSGEAATWLEPAPRARLIASWLVDGALEWSSSSDQLEEQSMRFVEGREGVLDDRIIQLWRALEGMVWPAVAESPSVDLTVLGREVVASLRHRSDEVAERGLPFSVLVREVLRKVIDRPEVAQRAPLVQEAVLLLGLTPTLRRQLGQLGPDDIRSWFPRLCGLLEVGSSGHPDGGQGSHFHDKALVAFVGQLGPTVGAPDASGPERAVDFLLALRALEVVRDQDVLDVFIDSLAAIEAQEIQHLGEVDPDLPARLAAVAERLSTPDAAEALRSAIVLGSILRLGWATDPAHEFGARRLIGFLTGESKASAVRTLASRRLASIPAEMWRRAASELPTVRDDLDADCAAELIDHLRRIEFTDGEEHVDAAREFYLALRAAQARSGLPLGAAASSARRSARSPRTIGDRSHALRATDPVDGVVVKIDGSRVMVDIGGAVLKPRTVGTARVREGVRPGTRVRVAPDGTARPIG